jgi:hypothetical protein
VCSSPTLTSEPPATNNLHAHAGPPLSRLVAPTMQPVTMLIAIMQYAILAGGACT